MIGNHQRLRERTWKDIEACWLTGQISSRDLFQRIEADKAFESWFKRRLDNRKVPPVAASFPAPGWMDNIPG